jgi:fused signal recognition particle receptor
MTDVSGIIMTKLDGTARGGILLSIGFQMHLPIVMVGLGEGIDDLKPFDKTSYILSLLNQEIL